MQREMTFDERNKVYLDLTIKMINNEIWNLEDENIKRFKIMMKLYLEYGKEFSGELLIVSIGKKLVYRFYNNIAKKTVAYLTKNDGK